MDDESVRATLELSKPGERNTRNSKQQTASITTTTRGEQGGQWTDMEGDIRPLFLALKKRKEGERKHRPTDTIQQEQQWA